MSKIEVNQISSQCGSTLTVGQSGDTVTLAAGATQTGFGRTGTVDWDTTAKTASFTAVSGVGYFVNTTSGAITVTLPAGSAGSIVSLKDYANTWQTNNVTVTPNGTDKINGANADATLNTQDQSITLVYVDDTKGWRAVQDSTSDVSGAAFIVATGGTITCCGDYKIHTFTGPGTFTVTAAGNPAGSDTVDYLVVAAGAGGGGAGEGGAGGGGAGGFRESCGAASGCYSTSPLSNSCGALPVTLTAYPIVVGAGGTGGVRISCTAGTNGSNSTFSTITSTGGGTGTHIGMPYSSVMICGSVGGSGGGGAGGGPSPGSGTSFAGNTPPVSPPQGNPGGTGQPGPSTQVGGGGGGATAVGSNYTPSAGGAGGAGATTSISASPTAYAGGGGAGSRPSCAGAGGLGGGGAGSNGSSTSSATAGTTNTGGGGGGGGRSETNPTTPLGGTGGSGGSGIVIIRYKFQ